MTRIVGADGVFPAAMHLLSQGVPRLALRGVSASGKTSIGAWISASYDKLVGGGACMVVEHEDALFEASELAAQYGRSASGHTLPTVLTIDDYWEQEPSGSLYVFDDADRYRERLPTQIDGQVVLTGDLSADFGWDSVQGEHLDITRSRVPDQVARLLARAYYEPRAVRGSTPRYSIVPGGSGTSLERDLASTGVAYVATPRSSGTRVSLAETTAIALSALRDLRILDSATGRSEPIRPDDVQAVADGEIPLEGEAGTLGLRMLPDVALSKPLITVVVCASEDATALRRCAATASMGVVVVAPHDTTLALPRIAQHEAQRRATPTT